MKKFTFSVIFLLSFVLCASAQFYSNGCDPGRTRWMQIRTDNFKVIFPQEADSLARVYAGLLEKYCEPVGATEGHTPNQNYRRPMPVILHPYTSNSNGSVTWTPRRMELYTTPDAQNLLPIPWETHLIIHESRHSAQMQFVNDPQYKPFRWLTGDLFGGGMAAVYGGPALFEGDAVAAETEMTSSGRGRSDAFLEYYKVALDNGDFRDWYKWRYSSQKKYTPDYYRLGYLTVAGERAVYNDPLLTSRYYERVRKHFLPLNNLNKTLKTSSGKNLRQTFREIEDTLITTWRKEAEARGPFMESEEVTSPGRLYTEINGTVSTPDGCYAIRNGMAYLSEIVHISPEGKITPQTNTAFGGPLEYCDTLKAIFWSERVSDPRWEMRSFSEIKRLSLKQGGKIEKITNKTRYYNPSASSIHPLIAVTSYPVGGGSEIVVLNARNGSEIRRWTAPAGMQFVNSEWVGEDLYASAVTPEGYGIYRLGEQIENVLAPFNASIECLVALGDDICFGSDINGVNELYRLNLSDGSVQMMTSSKWGASDYEFNAEEDTLFFSKLTPEGRILCKTAVEALPVRNIEFGVPHKEFFAEKISEQFDTLCPPQSEVKATPEATRYSKLGHLLRFHSWAPLYIDFDELKSLSFDNLFTSVGLGATAFFQNDLATMKGYVTWHAPSAGKLSFTYEGMYPVIEASLAVNERKAYDYSFSGDTLKVKSSARPLVNGDVKMYVPLRFNSGGWSRGVVPQVSASVSNDIMNRTESTVMNRICASARAYTMQNIPSSCIYPRWGIGIEAGYCFRAGMTDTFSPNEFIYLYGYIPGFARTHGIKITASAQKELYSNSKYLESYISMAPRGFAKTDGVNSAIAAYPFQSKFTIDYAMPFAAVDWSFLGPLAYIRNFELKAHYDIGYYSATKSTMTLMSAGADLSVRLGNLIWVPYDTRIGVSYCYNMGSENVNLSSPHYVGMIFSVDL